MSREVLDRLPPPDGWTEASVTALGEVLAATGPEERDLDPRVLTCLLDLWASVSRGRVVSNPPSPSRSSDPAPLPAASPETVALRSAAAELLAKSTDILLTKRVFLSPASAAIVETVLAEASLAAVSLACGEDSLVAARALPPLLTCSTSFYVKYATHQLVSADESAGADGSLAQGDGDGDDAPPAGPVDPDEAAWRANLLVCDWVDLRVGHAWHAAQVVQVAGRADTGNGAGAGGSGHVPAVAAATVSSTSAASSPAAAASSAAAASTVAASGSGRGEHGMAGPPPGPGYLLVSLDGASQEAGRGEWVPRHSRRLSKLYTRSRDFIADWRLQLVRGSHLDALDRVGYWFTAEVVEVKGSMLLISFDGWAASYNEWLSRTSPRLAPLRSKARGNRDDGGIRDYPSYSLNSFDDSADPPGAVVVSRGSKWGSHGYVKVVRRFVAGGGFQALTRRLLRGQVPVRLLQLLVEAAGACSDVLARSFAMAVVPAFRDAAFGAVLGLDKDQLRDLSKEAVQAVSRSVRTLLLRTREEPEVNRELERFELAAALLRLSSPIVERCLNGMDSLSTYMSHVRTSTYYNPSSLSRDEMADWIEENRVLDICLGPNSHLELAKRSVDVLKFLGYVRRFEQRHMDQVWAALQRAVRRKDDQAIKTLYKMMEDLVWALEDAHVVYLFRLLGTVPVPAFSTAALDLVKELSRMAYRAGAEVLENALALLWNLIQDDSKAEPAVAEAARLKLEEAVADFYSRSLRGTYLDLCIGNLRNHRSVPQSLDILQKILESFAGYSTSETRSKRLVIEELERDHGLLAVYLDDLLHYKALAVSEAASVVAPARVSAGGGAGGNKCGVGGDEGDVVAGGGIGGGGGGGGGGGSSGGDDARLLCAAPTASGGVGAGGAASASVPPAAVSPAPDTPHADPANAAQEAREAQIDALRLGGSEVPYLAQLKKRLAFLRYLLASSSLELSREQADRLWDALYGQALTAKDASAVLSWLRNAVRLESGRSHHVMLNDQLAEHLFLDKMKGSFDLSRLSFSQYALLERYFLHVNSARRVLELRVPSALSSYPNNYRESTYGPAYGPLSGAGYSAAAEAAADTPEDAPAPDFDVHNFEGLVGVDLLWGVALEAETEAVHRRGVEFLNLVHESLAPSQQALAVVIRGGYIRKCMAHFAVATGRSPDDRREGPKGGQTAVPAPGTRAGTGLQIARAQRCLSLLNRLLDTSEKQGTGNLRSHGMQVRGRVRVLVIQNNVPHSTRQRRLEVRVRDNDLMQEVRSACAAVLGVAGAELRIFYMGKELPSDQGGRRVHDVLRHDPVTLMVSRSAGGGDYGETPALLVREQMRPGLREALTEIYNRFLTPGAAHFNKANMGTYILACNVAEENASPSRLSTIFTQFGDDLADELTLPGFLHFYLEACQRRPDAVWADLRTHGYDSSLRPLTRAALASSVSGSGAGSGSGGDADGEGESKEAEEDGALGPAEKAMPGYLLASNDHYFDLLFSALGQEDGLASAVWTLLQRLPTNPALKHSLITLERVQSPEPDWNELLDQRSPYRLLYGLQIAESLAEVPDDDDDAAGTAGAAAAGTADAQAAPRAAGTGAAPSSSSAVDAAGNDGAGAGGAGTGAGAGAGVSTSSAADSARAAQAAVASEKRLEWQRRFLLSGGFRHLYGILLSRSAELSCASGSGDDDGGGGGGGMRATVGRLDDTWQGCMAVLLKMLRTFILSALAVSAPMRNVIQRIRSDSLDVKGELGAGGGQDDRSDLSSSQAEPSSPSLSDGDEGGAADGAPSPAPGGADSGAASGADSGTGVGAGAGVGVVAAGSAIAERSGSPELPGPPPLVSALSTGAASSAVDSPRMPGLDGADGSGLRPMRPAFVALIRQMSTGFADRLLAYLDFVELQQALLLQVQVAADLAARVPAGATVPDANVRVVEYSMSLWVAVLLARPEAMLARAYEEFLKPSRLFVPLHCRSSALLRQEFANGIYQVCLHCRTPALVVPPPGSAAAGIGYSMTVTPRDFFLGGLVARMPTYRQNSDGGLECAEHFWLLCHLTAEALRTPGDVVIGGLSASGLLSQVTGLLREHVSSEVRGGPRVDQVLVGGLRLAETLLARRRDLRHSAGPIMVEYVFRTLLFAAPGSRGAPATQPLCQTETSRTAAFRLLAALCRDSPSNHAMLVALLSEQQRGTTKLAGFDYNAEKHTKSPWGHVGLRNMGATCYMNSLLQQFYMIPEFRYGVLMTDTDPDEDRSESLLYQLQQMFAFLTFSEKQAYDTEPFCHAYKDERGQPINVRVQQDAQEFFNVLADRLENRLKRTPQAALFRDLFGGHLVNQLICHGGCGTVRERTEDFYTVSLEVKNKSDLADSLNSYVGGEMLGDFSCSTCQRRVDITKRSCLGELPHTLIFHLKRFELNFDTFQHQKVNNRFAFPLRVNLEPYTKEGLARRDAEQRLAEWQATHASAAPSAASSSSSSAAPDPSSAAAAPPSAEAGAGAEHGGGGMHMGRDRDRDRDGGGGGGGAAVAVEEGAPVVPAAFSVRPAAYYDYRLVGIIIHTGSAQAGHYYSYIRERNLAQSNGAEWLEFNDNYVKPFDISTLEEAAFGGERVQTESSYYGSEYTRRSEQETNAYMLVYERVDPSVVHTVAAAAARSPSSPEVPPASPGSSAGGAGSQNGGEAAGVSLQGIRALVEKNEQLERAPRTTANSLAELERAISEVDLRRVVPGRVLDAIETDNEQFTRDRQIFNTRYFRFVTDVLRLAPQHGAAAVEACRFGAQFAMDTVARAGDNGVFGELVSHVARLVRASREASEWLLGDAVSRGALSLSELLLQCRDQAVRKGLADLYVAALATAGPIPPVAAEAAAAADPDQQETGAQVCLRFIDVLLSLSPELHKNWLRFGEYFELLTQFAQLGPGNRRALVERGVIASLADLYLGDHSPRADRRKKAPQMGSPMGVQPDFAPLLRLVSLLFRSCATTAPASAGRPPTQTEGPVLPLRDEDHDVASCREFYGQALQNNHCPQAVGEVAAHWSYENAEFTGVALSLVLAGLARAQHDTARPYFEVLRELVGVRDSLQGQRHDRLLLAPDSLIAMLYRQRTLDPKFVYACIKLLINQLGSVPDFASRMMEHRQQWVWMDGWLKRHMQQLGAYGGRPALQRQESRVKAFSQYQEHVERLGGTISLSEADAPEPTSVANLGWGASAAGGGSGGGAAAAAKVNAGSAGAASDPLTGGSGMGPVSGGGTGGLAPRPSGANSPADTSTTPPLSRQSSGWSSDGEVIRHGDGVGNGGGEMMMMSAAAMAGAVVPVSGVRDVTAERSGRDSMQWNCLACTFANEGGTECAMCSTIRPA